MKVIEWVLLFLFLIGLTMKFSLIPGGSVLIIFSLTILSFLYCWLSFFFLNNIRLREVFKKSAYKGIGPKRWIYVVVSGMSVSILILGIIFKLMFWPGGEIIVCMGAILSLFIFILALLKFGDTKERFYKKIILRFFPYVFVGGTLVFMSNVDIVKLQYRNHPLYIQAYIDYNKDLDNKAKFDKMELERDRATMLPEEFQHFHPEEK